jgi:hypothetical protein
MAPHSTFPAANGDTGAIDGRVEPHRSNMCTAVLKNLNPDIDTCMTLRCPPWHFPSQMTML